MVILVRPDVVILNRPVLVTLNRLGVVNIIGACSSLKKSDKILVLSNYWKNFFDTEFRNLPVEVLSNGIDVQYFYSCINPSAEFNNYLFLGRMGERKGVYDLLEAINVIVNLKGIKHLNFYLAGDGELNQVAEIIHSRNLSENVKLLGWLDNDKKKALLKNIQTVILPSYDEGLPMSLIEAMACGKIIISTYAGGIPDLVKPGINGYLLNAGNIDQLVKHILFVSDNPQQMRPISENNIQKIYEHFNLDTIALKLNAIYRSL